MSGEEIEKQKELFGEFQKPEKKLKFFKNKNRFLPNRMLILQFSAEKLTFLLIGTVLLIILTFCLGVERGKRIASSAAKAPETMQVKAPVQAKAPTEKKSGSTEKIHTIRIATYINKASAENITAKIKKEGFPAYIVKSGNFFLICVGDYNTRQDAEAALSTLKKNYQDSYIKTTKKK